MAKTTDYDAMDVPELIEALHVINAQETELRLSKRPIADALAVKYGPWKQAQDEARLLEINVAAALEAANAQVSASSADAKGG